MLWHIKKYQYQKLDIQYDHKYMNQIESMPWKKQQQHWGLGIGDEYLKL